MLLNACGPVDRREVQRETSPDGILDAVFYVGSGGGAAGFALHEVHLVSKGERITGNDTRFLYMDGAYGTELEWVEPLVLEVRYPAGTDIKAFKGFTYRTNDPNKSWPMTRYEITLKRVPKKTLLPRQLEKNPFGDFP